MRSTNRKLLVHATTWCSFLLVVATVGATTIAGTAGNDTLRGGAAADRLNGKAGNDKLYGLGGNDVLTGGAGNDLLVGGPGADRLSCGAGRDTARGDATDTVAKDCEVVRGVRAPKPPAPPAPQPPAAPPVAPVTPGQYQGQTQNGNFVFLTVSANRTFTGLRVNDLPAVCNGGATLPGGEDFGDSVFTIRDDGSFAAAGNWDGSQVSGDIEFTHWDGRVEGRFGATSVSGTLVMNYGLKYQGTTYQCSSGTVTWTATLRP
jgi:RTX calcium-binding nonapeptide repeat (4 copies)